MIQVGQVAQFGGQAAMHELAIQNLHRRAGDITHRQRNGVHIFEFASDPDLTASIVLLPEYWRQTTGLTGPVFVAMPTRAEFLVCSVDDAHAVDLVTKTAPPLYEQARAKPISPITYRVDDQGFRPAA